METLDHVLVGKGETPLHLLLRMANRHGLIAGATGTGKTVTLQVLAEGLSRAGVPVFMADVKGDLSGISQAGEAKPKLLERAQHIGIENFAPRAYPTLFWDLFGEQGHPIRATVSDMGPLLLARLLDLNATQEGILNIAFKFADDQGMLLLDFKDLRTLLTYIGDNAKDLKTTYGNISGASVGAIQRSLLALEQQNTDQFFGEPALMLSDLMHADFSGNGVISILAADKLMQTPKAYSTFLLWLLAELFEELPEVGDQPKPRLVFFFDEAHLLFSDAPKALVEKIEQVVRLIRSKGVGIFFVTQNPLDIPESVLGQLGNRVQHALRAFTPRDQKAVRTAAQTLRANDALDTEKAITELGVGEALVSLLDAKGIPSIVQRALICPPTSRMGPASEDERKQVFGRSPIGGKYDHTVDRESAHELLQKRTQEATAAAEAAAAKSSAAKTSSKSGGSRRQGVGEAFAKSVARSVGSSLGRQILRGVLGAIFKGR